MASLKEDFAVIKEGELAMILNTKLNDTGQKMLLA